MGLRLVKGDWRKFLSLSVLRGSAPFVAALAACWLIGQVMAVNSWLTLCAACAVSAIVYVAVIFGFCLDDVDRRLAERLVGKITDIGRVLLKRGGATAE